MVFKQCNANPVMNMLQYISENSEGDERTSVDTVGGDIVSSYRL